MIDIAGAHGLLAAAGAADNDNFCIGLDCNDGDASIFPGASEAKHDGIDQDCNGYDLMIEIVAAVYDVGNDALSIEATSDLLKAANLRLVGHGDMRWNRKNQKWLLSISPVGGDPGSVIVAGVEGRVRAFDLRQPDPTRRPPICGAQRGK